MEVKCTSRLPRLEVSSDGQGIVSHVGIRLLQEMAEVLGLTDGLSEAMAKTQVRRGRHDAGKTLTDIAVMLADGGDCLSDLASLMGQEQTFGKVASIPTAWRTLDRITKQTQQDIAQARAEARKRAWDKGARPSWIVLDIDATLVESHSEKQFARPTYKKGFGFHPMMVYLDESGEALAGRLRKGNAGSMTASDQIGVLDEALDQLPVSTRGKDPEGGEWMLIRADSASCSHEFIDALRQRGLEFSVGHPLNQQVREAIWSLTDKDFTEAITQEMQEREGAEVAEITHLVDLSAWPEGTRMIVRREDPHPGAQLTFTDLDGHRFQCLITDSDDPDIRYLEARHRGHARIEDRIKEAKEMGLSNLPFHDFALNHAWLILVLTAQDLISFAKSLLFEGEMKKARIKKIRYRILSIAGRLVRTGRRLIVRLPRTWPWAAELACAFAKLRPLRI